MTGNSEKRLGISIQPRDLTLLRELSVLRIADREQVKTAAGFHSTTRVNTRLLALYRAGLLRRFFLGYSGARKALYALSPKGARLGGVPCHGPRRPQETMLVADYFVEHQLAVNALYCALKFGTMPSANIRFVQWQSFHEPIAQGINLIPDGYAELQTTAGLDASFIEIDLGHEAGAVWREKAKRYLQLAVSGEYERQFHRPRFRVLVFVHSARKLQAIQKAIAEITEKIFWFATLDEVRIERFFAPVWLRPTGTIHQPLFKETP